MWVSSEPTYEGLKQGHLNAAVHCPPRSEPTYEGLKLDGAVTVHQVVVPGSEPTYEGLKLRDYGDAREFAVRFGAYL